MRLGTGELIQWPAAPPRINRMDDISKARVAVVIPTHNRKRSLMECLESVCASDYTDIEIYVVNDGSSDGTATEVIANFPFVRVLNGDGTLWWSGAMNVGISAALVSNADYVLAINDDVIVHSGAIKALVECAQQNRGSIVGSLIVSLEQPEVIWCAGGELRWPWPGEFHVGSGQPNQGQFDGVRQVKWTPGMGTLMPRELLLKLGMYDAAGMPQYMADADYTLRAGKAGYRILVTSESKIFNRQGSTGGIADGQKCLRLRDWISMFSNLKSPEYFPARLIFMCRHCPILWLVPALLVRYARLLGFLLKRLAPLWR